MEDADRTHVLCKLWRQRRPRIKDEVALLRFHAWLEKNRPELLKADPGKKLDSYHQLKIDLKDCPATEL